MLNKEISKQIQQIRNLINKTATPCGGDLEMQSHWAKYICIRSAGLLENALAEIYKDFVNGAASKPVADYTCSILSKIQNPKANRFVEVASSFKPSWGIDLEAYLEAEGRKEAINSIMTNRHNIAHGKNSDISIVRIKEYLEKAIEVIEFIENQCKS